LCEKHPRLLHECFARDILRQGFIAKSLHDLTDAVVPRRPREPAPERSGSHHAREPTDNP
jgi:hypothetical protein